MTIKTIFVEELVENQVYVKVMSSIKDQSLTGFKWSAIGEVTIEDPPGFQAYREHPY